MTHITNTTEITTSEVHQIIKNTKGKMFTVTFIKMDGTERVLNGRLGVTKHLHGGADTTAHMSNYINIYDMKAEGYRKVNIEKVTRLIYGRTEYIVVVNDV